MEPAGYVRPPEIPADPTMRARRRHAGDGQGASRKRGDRRRPLGLTAREHRRLADVLLIAARERRAVEPLSVRYPELTVGDGCEIRDASLARRIAEGERPIGATASFGGAPAARRLRVPEPRVGWLTDRMLLPGTLVYLGDLIQPRVEPALAFRLSRPLRTPFATGGDLLAATDRVLPCLLVLDSRYDGGGLTGADDIADNCATARLVMGLQSAPPAEGHLRRLRVQLNVDGAPSEPGGARGPAVVSPLDAAAWLANLLVQEAREIQPGTLLVCPAAREAVALASGIRVTARFRSLGSVELGTAGVLRERSAVLRGSP